MYYLLERTYLHIYLDYLEFFFTRHLFIQTFIYISMDLVIYFILWVIIPYFIYFLQLFFVNSLGSRKQ